eukprot:1517235-Karenia_brevis.AAC.1
MLREKILALLDNCDVDSAFYELRGPVSVLSMQRSGCCAVQATLMAASHVQLLTLINELRGH